MRVRWFARLSGTPPQIRRIELSQKAAIMSGISIIIPTYNRAGLLKGTLESVQSLRIPQGWRAEVVVVDNNSTDQTAMVVAETDKMERIPIRCVIEPRQGTSNARNRGILESTFSDLVFFDDDVMVDPDWLEGYVEARVLLQAD